MKKATNTKGWQDLTELQQGWYSDWLNRVVSELGMTIAEAVQHFNDSSVDFQQYVVRRPWVGFCGNGRKNVPIKRNLLKNESGKRTFLWDSMYEMPLPEEAS